jgi:hypothetical protein
MKLEDYQSPFIIYAIGILSGVATFISELLLLAAKIEALALFLAKTARGLIAAAGPFLVV